MQLSRTATRILSELTDADQSSGESTLFIRELNISGISSPARGGGAGYRFHRGLSFRQVVMVTGGGGSIGSKSAARSCGSSRSC